MATGRFFVGTSGFAYKEWIGPFYPPGTKSGAMLGFYAGAFNSVETALSFFITVYRRAQSVIPACWATDLNF